MIDARLIDIYRNEDAMSVPTIAVPHPVSLKITPYNRLTAPLRRLRNLA